MRRQARANVTPKRQPSQYSCVATSLSMALQALGIPEAEASTAQVNKVLGAMPLRGAAWEQAAAAASHYGCRVTLVIPSTLKQVRAWTDAGTPVLIGWNTGNEWSHASLIFDVNDTHVFVADPNIPNPEQTVRVLTHDEFYEKWWETASEGYKIRRPAMAVEREITPDGRQVMASGKVASTLGYKALAVRVADRYAASKRVANSLLEDIRKVATGAVAKGYVYSEAANAIIVNCDVTLPLTVLGELPAPVVEKVVSQMSPKALGQISPQSLPTGMVLKLVTQGMLSANTLAPEVLFKSVPAKQMTKLGVSDDTLRLLLEGQEGESYPEHVVETMKLVSWDDLEKKLPKFTNSQVWDVGAVSDWSMESTLTVKNGVLETTVFTVFEQDNVTIMAAPQEIDIKFSGDNVDEVISLYEAAGKSTDESYSGVRVWTILPALVGMKFNSIQVVTDMALKIPLAQLKRPQLLRLVDFFQNGAD